MKFNATTTDGQVGLQESVQQCLGAGARAALVTKEGRGFKITPVEHAQSLVNLDTELLDHLSASVHSDEYLQALRDYCDGRLAARREARSSGGFVVPKPKGGWSVMRPLR